MFERFAELIELPPLPVSFDLSLWLDNAEMFYDLDAAIETKEPLDLPDKRFDSLVEDIQEGENLYTPYHPLACFFTNLSDIGLSNRFRNFCPNLLPYQLKRKKYDMKIIMRANISNSRPKRE